MGFAVFFASIGSASSRCFGVQTGGASGKIPPMNTNRPATLTGTLGAHLPSSTQPKLLIIDADTTALQVLCQTFESDHQVFKTTRGAKGLALALEKRPDLVLLDANVPDMESHEIAQQIKTHDDTRDIPIVYMAARQDSAAETRALALGAVDVLSKPINPTLARARIRLHLTLRRQAEQLRSMARVDGLTGVYNRKHFDERFELEFRRCLRSRSALALALVDIDEFRAYNDQYGHAVGDECVVRVAGALKASLKRAGDLLARFDGDTFACVLPEVRLEAAPAFAQTLVYAVRDLNLAHARSRTAAVVTVSLGMAVFEPDDLCTAPQLLAATSHALAQAKKEGRARACVVSVRDARAA